VDEREGKTSPEDTFYVGYLAAPASTIRLTRILAVASLVALILLGAALATARRDPGSAVWDTAMRRTFRGSVQSSPYPMMHLTEASGEVPSGTTLLIVEMGKHGGQRAAPLDGHRATLTGYLLVRDERRMIELDEGPDALQDDGPDTSTHSETSLGEVDLAGEIVDSKCYLGAMKPGDGRVHKECAIRCVSAGIPPMLVVRDPLGQSAQLVLCDQQGAPLGPRLLPLVGSPARVRGEVLRRGDLFFLRTTLENIRTVDDVAQRGAASDPAALSSLSH